MKINKLLLTCSLLLSGFLVGCKTENSEHSSSSSSEVISESSSEISSENKSEISSENKSENSSEEKSEVSSEPSSDSSQTSESGTNVSIESISLETRNVRTNFDLNEKFDYTGLQVNVHLSNGKSEIVFAEDCKISSPDMSIRGQKEITVTYQEKSASYNIYVRELESISVDTSNVQSRFDISEEFTYEGLIVFANYYDGIESEQISEGVEIITPDLSKYGQKEVVVKYNGKTTSYNVTVASTPTISSIDLIKDGEKLYLTVSGTAFGYQSTDFDLDIQETNTSDWKKHELTPEVTYAENAFALKAELPLSTIDSLNNVTLISHLIVGGTSYDLVGIDGFEDKTIEIGNKTLTLGNKDIFSNSTYYMGIEVKDTVQRSYEIQNVTIENRNDRVIYIVSGTCSGYSESDFSMDVQETANAWQKIELEETVTITDNNFEIVADITDVLSNSKYISHIKVGEASIDLKNNEGIQPKEITVNSKTFKLSSTDVFNNGTDYYAYIELVDENPVVKEYSLTNVTIENRNDRVIYIVSGTCSGYSESDFSIDVQETANSWQKIELEETVTITDNNFEIVADITDVLSNSKYISHIKVGETLIDLKNNEGIQPKEITVNGKTFKLTYTDVFNNGTDYYAYIELVDSNPVVKEYSMSNVTIENRDNRLFYVVTGTYQGYSQSDFDLDIQEFNGTWATSSLDPIVTLNEQEGTFEVAADITDNLQTNSTYFFHIMVGSTEQINVMDIEGVIETTVTINETTYSLVINDLFSNQHDFLCVVKNN